MITVTFLGQKPEQWDGDIVSVLAKLAPSLGDAAVRILGDSCIKTYVRLGIIKATARNTYEVYGYIVVTTEDDDEDRYLIELLQK